jgi:hypothetical protein
MKMARKCDERLMLNTVQKVSLSATGAKCNPHRKDSLGVATIPFGSVVWESFNARGSGGRRSLVILGEAKNLFGVDGVEILRSLGLLQDD